MKQRKFRSKTAAQRVAKVVHSKAVRVRSAVLSDGAKGAWYKFVRPKTKRKARK